MPVDIEKCVHVLNQARRQPDEVTQHTALLADQVAVKMREEFGDTLDMETCGKALVIAASAVVPLCTPDVPAALVANLIGFLGEDLVRNARTTGSGGL